MHPYCDTKRRRDIRYPVRLPVTVRLAHTEKSGRSENLSLSGVLLTGDFLIPEGSIVELAVGVAKMPDCDFFLTARGTVLRVQPREPGEFAMAIGCDSPFRITSHKTEP
jgi:hypothetical protein